MENKKDTLDKVIDIINDYKNSNEGRTPGVPMTLLKAKDARISYADISKIDLEDSRIKDNEYFTRLVSYANQATIDVIQNNSTSSESYNPDNVEAKENYSDNVVPFEQESQKPVQNITNVGNSDLLGVGRLLSFVSAPAVMAGQGIKSLYNGHSQNTLNKNLTKANNRFKGTDLAIDSLNELVNQYRFNKSPETKEKIKEHAKTLDKFSAKDFYESNKALGKTKNRELKNEIKKQSKDRFNKIKDLSEEMKKEKELKEAAERMAKLVKLLMKFFSNLFTLNFKKAKGGATMRPAA